jgi:hypothetical protein
MFLRIFNQKNLSINITLTPWLKYYDLYITLKNCPTYCSLSNLNNVKNVNLYLDQICDFTLIS